MNDTSMRSFLFDLALISTTSICWACAGECVKRATSVAGHEMIDWRFHVVYDLNGPGTFVARLLLFGIAPNHPRLLYDLRC